MYYCERAVFAYYHMLTAISVEGVEYGRGTSGNKREASQIAAAFAFAALSAQYGW